MIEECVPFSYIDRLIERMEKERDYALYGDEINSESEKLSHKIDALRELKRMWLSDRRF